MAAVREANCCATTLAAIFCLPFSCCITTSALSVPSSLKPRLEELLQSHGFALVSSTGSLLTVQSQRLVAQTRRLDDARKENEYVENKHIKRMCDTPTSYHKVLQSSSQFPISSLKPTSSSLSALERMVANADLPPPDAAVDQDDVIAYCVAASKAHGRDTAVVALCNRVASAFCARVSEISPASAVDLAGRNTAYVPAVRAAVLSMSSFLKPGSAVPSANIAGVYNTLLLPLSACPSDEALVIAGLAALQRCAAIDAPGQERDSRFASAGVAGTLCSLLSPSASSTVAGGAADTIAAWAAAPGNCRSALLLAGAVVAGVQMLKRETSAAAVGASVRMLDAFAGLDNTGRDAVRAAGGLNAMALMLGRVKLADASEVSATWELIDHLVSPLPTRPLEPSATSLSSTLLRVLSMHESLQHVSAIVPKALEALAGVLTPASHGLPAVSAAVGLVRNMLDVQGGATAGVAELICKLMQACLEVDALGAATAGTAVICVRCIQSHSGTLLVCRAAASALKVQSGMKDAAAVTALTSAGASAALITSLRTHSRDVDMCSLVLEALRLLSKDSGELSKMVADAHCTAAVSDAVVVSGRSRAATANATVRFGLKLLNSFSRDASTAKPKVLACLPAILSVLSDVRGILGTSTTDVAVLLLSNYTDSNIDAVVSAGGIPMMQSALSSSDSELARQKACHFFAKLSGNSSRCQAIVDGEIHSSLLSALSFDATSAASASLAISKIAEIEGLHEKLDAAGAPRALISALKKHGAVVAVDSNCKAALSALARGSRKVKLSLVEAGAREYITIPKFM